MQSGSTQLNVFSWDSERSPRQCSFFRAQLWLSLSAALSRRKDREPLLPGIVKSIIYSFTAQKLPHKSQQSLITYYDTNTGRKLAGKIQLLYDLAEEIFRRRRERSPRSMANARPCARRGNGVHACVHSAGRSDGEIQPHTKKEN